MRSANGTGVRSHRRAIGLRFVLRSKALLAEESGIVLIFTTIVIPVILLLLAFVVEMGHALVTRAEQQRAADLAAVTGGLLSAQADPDGALADAKAIAALNSPRSDGIVVEPGPPSDGFDTVRVVLSRELELQIARLVGLSPTLDVQADAVAIVPSNDPPCVTALDPWGSGIQLTGNAILEGPECLIGSNVSLSVPCGTSIIAKTLTYRTAEPYIGCGNARKPDGSIVNIRQMEVVDPLAGHQGLAMLSQARIQAASLEAPPPTGAPDLHFGYGNKPATGGCSAVEVSSGHWVVDCPAREEAYSFGRLTLQGGVSVNFATSGDEGNTYRFTSISGGGGTSSDFGPGSYHIAQGVFVDGGGTMKFAGGDFRIGPSPTTGRALDVSGGADLGFGGYSNSFEVRGNIATSGGSCLILPAAPTHLIRGTLSATGGVVLGSGLWVFDSYLALATGGKVLCDGRYVALEAIGATIAVKGNADVTGDCAGRSFCIGAGFDGAVISAPADGPFASLSVIGPSDADNGKGAFLGGGAANTRVNGVFYFPHGSIVLNGGADIGDGGDEDTCLQLIGSEITFSGGTSGVSSCISSSNQFLRTRLVQ